MQTIVNNIVTEYQDDGNGPVILLLHGWKDSLHTFDSLVPLLTESYRVVRLDLPGFGQSGQPPVGSDLSEYVDFVSSFIKKINLDVQYMVGHSFGARIIIKGVGNYHFDPKKVVLIGAAGISKSKTLRSVLYMIVAKIGKFFTSIPPFSLFRSKLKQRLYAAAGSDYLGAGSLQQVYLNVIREDLAQYASKILVPTLLIWGSEDDQTPLSDGEIFSKVIKNSQLEVFKHKGHFVHKEEPGRVAKFIKGFCIWFEIGSLVTTQNMFEH